MSEEVKYSFEPSVIFEDLQKVLLDYAHSYITTVNDHVGVDVRTFHTEDEDESAELQDKIAQYLETPDFKEEWLQNQAVILAELKGKVDKALDMVMNEVNK